MTYIEILKKHGIVLCTDEKIEKYRTFVYNIIKIRGRTLTVPSHVIITTCQAIGFNIDRYRRGVYVEDFLLDILLFNEKYMDSDSFVKMLSVLSVVLQQDFFNSEALTSFPTLIKDGLNQFDLPYIFVDNIIIPKGEKILDDGVVLYVLERLKAFPIPYKNFCTALQQYLDKKYVRNIADNLRFSIENYIKNMIGNKHFRLENVQSQLGPVLASKGVATYMRNLICNSLVDYCKYQNEYVKHNEEPIPEPEIEFLMYFSGSILRYLLTV